MSLRVSSGFHVGFRIKMSKQSGGFVKGFFPDSFKFDLGFLLCFS